MEGDSLDQYSMLLCLADASVWKDNALIKRHKDTWLEKLSGENLAIAKYLFSGKGAKAIAAKAKALLRQREKHYDEMAEQEEEFRRVRSLPPSVCGFQYEAPPTQERLYQEWVSQPR